MSSQTIATPAGLSADASTLRSSLIATAFVVLWSTGYIAGKLAIEQSAPFTALTLRFAGAAVMFALLLLWSPPRWPVWSVLGHSVIAGLLNLALQFGGVYGAFALGASSGFAALVIGTMPLAVSATSALLGERQPMSHWLGLCIGFAGVVLVLEDRLGSGIGSAAAGVALLLGLVGITFGTLYQKRHAAGLDLRIGLLVQNLSAAVVLAPLALLHEHFRFEATASFAAVMLWIVLVNSGAAFALLFVLLREGAATRVSALFYLVTPVTALMGFALMHEPMSLLKIAGFALAAAGVYIGTRSAKPAR
jgi:drug/metabolite transporter (DMT)-like permease